MGVVSFNLEVFGKLNEELIISHYTEFMELNDDGIWVCGIHQLMETMFRQREELMIIIFLKANLSVLVLLILKSISNVL